LDLDRDQDRMRKAIEDSETPESAASKVELPPGALDGAAGADIFGDEDPSILRPLGDDGVVYPEATTQGAVASTIVDDGEPDLPEVPKDDLIKAVTEASSALDDGAEPGELVERARTLDLTDVDPGDEVKELRTVDSRTFLDEDGKFRTELGSEPMFAEDASGDLVEPNMNPRGSRDQRWRPTAGAQGVSFGSSAQDKALGTVSFGPGMQLSWSLKGADHVAGVRRGDHVSYDEVFDDVDLQMESSLRGAKETIVIQDASAPTVYEFPLSLTGIKARLDDPHGSIVLLSTESGEPVGTIPAAWAQDSAPLAADRNPDPGSVTYELIGSGGSTVLRVSIDQAWFHDPARVFPVRVDPPVNGDFVMSGDTWIHSQYPTTNRSTSPVLEAGGGWGGKRTYLARWDIGWLVSATIIDAEYDTFNSWSYSCTGANFEVHRITSNWNPATVTWGSQPSYAEAVNPPKNVSYGWHPDGQASPCPAQFITHPNMQSVVQKWVDGVYPAFGLEGRVAANDSYDPNNPWTYKQFVSTEWGGQKLQLVWSPWRVKYELIGNKITPPTATTAGSAQIKVTNKAPTTWNATGANRYRLGYHVYRVDNGQLVNFEGRRADLPGDVGWGKSQTVNVTIDPLPVLAGGYFIDFDMMQEGVDWFSRIGPHDDLLPKRVFVAVGNTPPALQQAGPSGMTETRTPTLSVTGVNPDNYPAGSTLEYYFKLCEDKAMAAACRTQGWSATNRWQPTDLVWGKTYYWNAAVRETGSGGLTTQPIWKAPLTPTLAQPKVEKHFGSDPYAPLHHGVNPSIGNYVTSTTDVNIAAAGLPVSLARTYNSLDTRVGAFGPGWSTFLDMSATSETGGKLMVSFPDGRQERYGENPDGSWASPIGNASVLRTRNTGGWELERPDRIAYLFDASGKPAGLRDGWGNQLTFERTPTTGPVTKVITAPSQRYITLGWQPIGPGNAPVVTSVQANAPAPGQASPSWTYSYNSDGRLVGVCAPGEPEAGAACSTYKYYATGESSSAKAIGKLQWAKRQEGNYAIQLDYASNGRVKWVKDGENNQWSFSNDDAEAEGTYHALNGAVVQSTALLGANATATVDVTGVGGVPDNDVQTVVVDIGVLGSTTGWLAAYPSGTSEPPGVSTMDYYGQLRSTLHTVAVGSDGKISVTNHGQPIFYDVEVVGWYAKAGVADGLVFMPLPSARIYDSRQSGSGGKIGAGASRNVQMLGQGGVPTEGVSAVVYDVEAVSPTTDTALTAFPKGTTRPGVTTLQIAAGRVADNLHVTKVSSDGQISIYNASGQLDVAVDVVGYFADPSLYDGSVYRPVTNQRLLDSRQTTGQWLGTPALAGTRTMTVAGEGTFPARGITALVGDIQALWPVGLNPMWTNPSGGGGGGATYLGQDGLGVGNHLYTGLGNNGAIDIASAKSVHLLVDAVGYFAPVPRTTFVLDPRGNTIEYRYDELGRLVSREDEAGLATAFAYDDAGFLASKADETGAQHSYTYDAKGHLLSERIAEYGTFQSETQEVWGSTKYLGYVVDTTNPALDGKLAWSSDGRSADAADVTYRTTYQYNPQGQPIRVRGPAIPGANEGVGVDRGYTTGQATPDCPEVAPAGLQASERSMSSVLAGATPTNDDGLLTRYCYNPKGDLTRILRPSGLVESFTYDDLGQVKTASQQVAGFPDPLTTTNVYDAKGRLTQTIGPRVTSAVSNPSQGRYHQTSVVRQFTPNGNAEKVITSDLQNVDSRWVSYVYDDNGHKTHTSDNSGRSASRSYDANGNLATETDYAGATLAYGYDRRNVVSTVTAKDVVDDPLASPAMAPHDITLMSYGYDAAGRRVTETDAKGRTTYVRYRADGRREQVISEFEETDPSTGLPNSLRHRVLQSDVQMDAAGNAIATFAPTNTASVDDFDGNSLSGWQATGSWALGSGQLSSNAAGTLLRPGTKDGLLTLTVGAAAPPVSARFRVKDSSNYSEIVIKRQSVGGNLYSYRLTANQVTDGIVRTFDDSGYMSTVSSSRLSIAVAGNRVRVSVNSNSGPGTLLINSWIPGDSDGTSIGVVATAAGQGAERFRWDAYQRTENSFDPYGRMVGQTVDPGGANLRTESSLRPDGRPVSVRKSNAVNPGNVEETRYDYVPNGSPGAGQEAWSEDVVDRRDFSTEADDVLARTSFTYDQRGLRTQVIQPEGGVVDSVYDELGQLVRETGPTRTLVRYNQPDVANYRSSSADGYDAFGELIDEEDALGNLTSHEYDGRGLRIKTTLPSYTPPGGTPIARTITSTYDDSGRVLSQTDPMGEITKFTYNTRGFKIAEENPAVGTAAPGVARFVYDNTGRLVQQTDPTGAVVQYRLDDLGRPTATVQQVRQPSAASYVSTSLLGDAGGVLRTQSSEGVVATSEYDIAGRLIRTRDADGNATTFGYDDFQRMASITTPDGRLTQVSYNLVGDTTSERTFGPNGTSLLGESRLTWDREHHTLTAASPAGVAGDGSGTFAMEMVYDKAGQPTQRTTPVAGGGNSIVESWGYDQLGQATRYTDGRNNVTSQTYNLIGLPEDAVLPAAGSQTAVTDRRWRTTYDAAGRPTSQAAPGGLSVTSTYDELGRLIQQAGSGAQATTATRSFSYDLVGRMKTAGTPTASQTFTYDDRGLTLSSSGASGASEFVYDGDGRLTQQTDASGVMQFTYDNRGLPDTMTSSLSGTATYAFDPAARPETIDYSNGTTRTFTYDAWGRVDVDKLATNTAELYKADYGYDLDGNVISKAVTGTNVPAAGANTYSYDRSSRITSWQAPGGSTESYTWDKASNRTQSGSPAAPTTATFDEQNRLVTASGPAGLTTNTWSANGTLDQQTVQRRVTLVVADPASLTNADVVLGYVAVANANASLTIVDDGAAAPAATSTDVVVISPSVNPTTLGNKYKDLAAPVVNVAAASWQGSGLTSAGPSTTSGTSAYVNTAGHPIAAGKTGTVALLTSSDTINPAPSTSLGAGAVKVWTASSSSPDAVVAVYDTAAVTPGGAAAARRVTIGLSSAALGKLSTDGVNVYAEAVKWADSNASTTFGTTNFDFDAFEQLSKITAPGLPVVNHTYDALGRRLTSPTGSLSYAGTAIRPSADGTSRYQPGPAGILGLDDMTNGGGVWAHLDQHSDVVGTFAAGATQLSGAQAFSPWGQPLAQTGASIPVGYQSERRDLPGGLIGMGVREYNPATGTFISHDPVSDPAVPNGYSYTPGNPLGHTDPTGMFDVPCAPNCNLNDVKDLAAQASGLLTLAGASLEAGIAGEITILGLSLEEWAIGISALVVAAGLCWLFNCLNSVADAIYSIIQTLGAYDLRDIELLPYVTDLPPPAATPITKSCHELALMFGDNPSVCAGGSSSGTHDHTGGGSDSNDDSGTDGCYQCTTLTIILNGVPEPQDSPMQDLVNRTGSANPDCDGRYQLDPTSGKTVDTGNQCLITTVVVPTFTQVIESTVPTFVLSLVSGQSDDRVHIPGLDPSQQRVGEGECGYTQGQGDVGSGELADTTWDCDKATSADATSGSGRAGSKTCSNTTRTGVRRNNPADWKRTQAIWDAAGLGDILSEDNRRAISKNRAPVVDEQWVAHFPGDNDLMGQRISPHHIGGSILTIPLPFSRHLDAHMPGGFRYNPGGPGACG
jgi:RHS repeat-associated protein